MVFFVFFCVKPNFYVFSLYNNHDLDDRSFDCLQLEL